MTFDNEEFDVFVAQDVFEHIFHPDAAIKEVARTLRPGGFCFLSVPVANGFHTPTTRRASISNNEITHHLPESYHGSPVGGGKSLVTIDWSLDIANYLSFHSGMSLNALLLDDMRLGVRDPFNIVIFGRKGLVPEI